MVVAYQLATVLVFEVGQRLPWPGPFYMWGSRSRGGRDDVMPPPPPPPPQNVVFGLRILVAYLIPDVPGPVRMAIEREKYLQKLAFEGEDEDKLYSDEDLDAELADMTRKKRT